MVYSLVKEAAVLSCKPGSFHVQWHVTERCNLGCLHCYREPHRSELSLDNLIALAGRLDHFALHRSRSLVITLTGGEPFLKAEIYDLAKHIDRLDSVEELNIISNGTILPAPGTLEHLGTLNKLYLSLESHVPGVNDGIRGAGVLEVVTNNARLLRQRGFSLGIMTTLMNRNIRSLISGFRDYCAFLRTAAVSEVIFERFVPVGQAEDLVEEILSEELFYSFVQSLADYCDADFDGLLQFKAFKLVFATDDVSITDDVTIMGAECTSGKDGVALLCDGTVYPCRRLAYSLGSLLDHDLDVLLAAPDEPERDCLDYLHCRALSSRLHQLGMNADKQ